MGDRGQVHIKDTGVYLYTHWGASELIDTVKSALSKKWRWDDDEYLTRIIFDEMTSGCNGEETGFGIGSQEHGDVWRLIEINCENKEIKVMDNGKQVLKTDFKSFIES